MATSSGLAAVRLGDNALAIRDIFGGNAFQVCLFLVADVVAGQPVLPTAGRLNSWLASLGVALTAVYATGVIGRLLFALGIAGLFVLPHRGRGLQRTQSWSSRTPNCGLYS